MNFHVPDPHPLRVTDPRIRKLLQLAGLRFACTRARWLESELTRIGVALKAGTMTADEVDAELEAMGALDLVYPELMTAPEVAPLPELPRDADRDREAALRWEKAERVAQVMVTQGGTYYPRGVKS